MKFYWKPEIPPEVAALSSSQRAKAIETCTAEAKHDGALPGDRSLATIFIVFATCPFIVATLLEWPGPDSLAFLIGVPGSAISVLIWRHFRYRAMRPYLARYVNGIRRQA